jgi:hypothetical protein
MYVMAEFFRIIALAANVILLSVFAKVRFDGRQRCGQGIRSHIGEEPDAKCAQRSLA